MLAEGLARSGSRDAQDLADAVPLRLRNAPTRLMKDLGYGHGYQYNTSPKWRTIMAYACSGGCPRLNYWSNPNKLYNGKPMGTTTRSDNTRVLNTTRGTVAAFR